MPRYFSAMSSSLGCFGPVSYHDLLTSSCRYSANASASRSASALTMIDLLAQHRKAHAVLEGKVVAVRPRRPEAVHAACLQPAVGLDLVEQLLCVPEQLPRCRAVGWAVEDRGVLALQLPSMEEEGP